MTDWLTVQYFKLLHSAHYKVSVLQGGKPKRGNIRRLTKYCGF